MEEATSQAQIEKLRAVFVKKKDNVNLAWLDATLKGPVDLEKLALETGRTVTEFYDAARRRKRIVVRLAAEAQGVKYDEDDEEKPE